ncbi:unnamed protein product [Parnassius apollo]|uniref:(apollo) hypothetical protein n=1 Tax=Parnassius apollo TaxID=110799 RepID=A0A8S3Y527_PARAO|nr:unnamed protein product [Parnassius apollo]
MRRHLFDMLSRGVLELFPSTNTARRAGQPPANLFLNILAKKEKCKIKDAEKKRNKRSQKTQSQETESQNVNYKKIIEYPTFTDNTQIFESPTSTSSTQISESPAFTEKPIPTLRHANDEHTGSGQAKRRRKNTDYTQTKQIRNTESHRATRQIPVIIQAEQQRNTQAHRLARENPIFRDTEQQRDTQAHREARENPIFRDTEQQRNTHAHRIARKKPVFRDIEQRRDTQARQIAREDPHYSQIERARDTRARQSARCNSINDWHNVKRKYFDNTKEGYNHPCSCCGRLWHKNSVRKLIKHSISTKYNAEFALSVFNLNPCDESAEFCCTCAKYITQGRMPRLAIANGLKFPDIPDVLNELTSMEERLHRGSPHAHMMLWLDEAPTFEPGDTASARDISKFVDNIISCNSTEVPDKLRRLQLHKHTHTCRPTPDRLCRFEMPFFPMDKTKVLIELSKDDLEFKKSKQLAKDICQKIQNIPAGIYTFVDFLDWIRVSYEDYILAIRSTLKRPTVVLQRRPQDVFINPFSKKILALHKANMDIQFILDPFACAVYIVDYINKADRGMSRLLREALDEAKKENKSVKDSLRIVSNIFLNSSEISAQEAIYVLTGLPLSRASEAAMYINTSLPQERVHILKSYLELQSLEPDSSDIFQRH